MLRLNRHILVLILLCIVASLSVTSFAADRYITVASTTSTENSGLFDQLLPEFTGETGIEVRVVAVGTGRAIKLAERGDADVLLVHHKSSEDRFVEQGFGVQRFDLMYNDFVIVGPSSDPANVKQVATVSEGLRRIVQTKNLFASRGDDSGTHKKELYLWKSAGVEGDGLGTQWYRETGSSMGATLNVASGLDAYTLTDRATWLKFSNKGNLEIVLQGDSELFNQYGVILVNPQKHRHVKQDDGSSFIEWLLSPKGQETINRYSIDGNQAFFANAHG